MVLGAHLIVVWLLVSSRQLSVKTKSENLQLVWMTRPALTASAAETLPEKARNPVSRHGADRTTASPSTAAPSNKEDKPALPLLDWTEELHVAAKNAVAQELAKKRHELDFAHVYPKAPTKAPQIAWDYAATHRVESLPEGGILIHLSDNCVLALMPFPFVGCGIGKSLADGGLFEHMHEK
jgi:hypothetical protein